MVPSVAKDKGLTLYEHVEALAVVDTWFDEAMPDIQKAEGEVPEALAALLDMASGSFNEKAERVALKVNQYLAEAAAIETEADRLARRAKSRKARADHLKRYLHLCLTKAGVPKVNGLLLNVRIQKNSQPSVRCALTKQQLEALYHDEVAQHSASIVHKIVDYELSSRMALQVAHGGGTLPEGITIEHGSHIRID